MPRIPSHPTVASMFPPTRRPFEKGSREAARNGPTFCTTIQKEVFVCYRLWTQLSWPVEPCPMPGRAESENEFELLLAKLEDNFPQGATGPCVCRGSPPHDELPSRCRLPSPGKGYNPSVAPVRMRIGCTKVCVSSSAEDPVCGKSPATMIPLCWRRCPLRRKHLFMVPSLAKTRSSSLSTQLECKAPFQ